MYSVRQWSVTHSRKLGKFYDLFESMLFKLHPLFNAIGYERLEKPVRVVEQAVKGFLFDCQMCGQCALSSTGMSCPMNCPKTLRNGPCGGVRLDGNCEVKPEMRCVWVEGWRGSSLMQDSNAIRQVQVAVDFSLKGSSSWLRVSRENAEAKALPDQNSEVQS
ncbi:MAG: hypothetical protein ACI9YO_000231 [Gammaproteobacteria bacterium]